MPTFTLPCVTPRPPRSRGLWMTDDRPGAAGLPSQFGGPGIGGWGSGVPVGAGPGWWPGWPPAAWPSPGVCVSVRPLDLVPADRVAQTSLVLDAAGRRLAALHGPEDRTAVPLAKVSRWMGVAVVDTEDARFWRHGGVDWLAVARAAARDLEHGRVVEGGSTITQQYVKNTYVTGERTLRRKLAEAGHAWGLEWRNGKRAILEAYLNPRVLRPGGLRRRGGRPDLLLDPGRPADPDPGGVAGRDDPGAVGLRPVPAPPGRPGPAGGGAGPAERHGHLSPAARRRAAAAPLGLRPGGPVGATAAAGDRRTGQDGAGPASGTTR